jgi:acetolactate synthase-1/2/3 large subunit
MSVKVYERILDLFEAEGIKTIFGIPDPNFVHLFHRAEERGWDVVAPHHEEAGGFMAEAVSRMTGKAAVCAGTLGPGIANLVGAIICASVENSPVIFIGGQRARITEQRVRRGRIQFVQQAGLIEPAVKYSASIEYPEQTDEIIREGLRKALTGTPGPVYIEYPSHVIQADLEVEPAASPETYRLVNQTVGGDRIAEAVRLIGAARQPVLLVGHGVHTSRGGQSVKKLAEALVCPVIQTSGGTSYLEGLEERTFPYGFSDAAVEAVTDSDLCIAIGTELGEPVHFGRGRHWEANNANRKWILIEQDPEAIGVNRPIDLPLVGDLRAIVPQLADALADAPRVPSPQLDRWIKEESARIANLAASAPSGMSPVHPAQLIVEATKAFPPDGIMVRDGGATTIFGWTYSQAKPHDVIWNLFHIAELETAARLNLPLVCVVSVDYNWGLELAVYKRTFGPDSLETGVHWSTDTRLDKVAEGFGCYGEYVDRGDQIGPAIKRAYASGRPGVIHVAVDPRANSEDVPGYPEFRTWYAEGQQ